MTELAIRIAGETVSISDAGLHTKHNTVNGKDYLSIDLWADNGSSPEHFLAINGFAVDCTGVPDLQGRTFVLAKKNGQEREPEGNNASGELLESVMGNSPIDPLMFESISLKFGKLDDARIPVEIVASVFNSAHSGIAVEGNIIAKCGRYDDSTSTSGADNRGGKCGNRFGEIKGTGVDLFLMN